MSELSVLIETDGGARGNPGPAGAGVVIKDAADGKVLFAGGFFLGKTTNNQAEYQGLLQGLEKAAALGATSVEVRSDSELLVRQMTGLYRVKNEGLKPLFAQANQLARQFRKCAFTYVPRDQNELADRLVNQAINLGRDIVEKL